MGLLLPIVAMVGFSSCNKTNEALAPESIETRATIKNVPTIISTNTTWTANYVYRLRGKVFVTNGATLTIKAGTKVMGAYNSNPKLASALIVTPGSKIIANGTASAPIVMTAENGKKGGWGGLVILGKAPINQKEAQLIEGIDESVLPTGVNVEQVKYGTPNGGGSCSESSGSLKYVRVEFAGASISANNELNAFTFGGVGSGTTLSHLQAYHGADDAFEFFGGCVNADHLVSTATDDDAFDFDFGYTGKVTYAVATIDRSMSYSSDPNGIECDNDALNNKKGSDNKPYTRPVLNYITIVGTTDGRITGGGGDKNNLGYLKSGANFRRNTQFELSNSVICGFPKGILKETNNDFILENNYVTSTPKAGMEFATFTPDPSNLIENPLSDAFANPLTAEDLELLFDYSGVGAFANGSSWFTAGSWVKGY